MKYLKNAISAIAAISLAFCIVLIPYANKRDSTQTITSAPATAENPFVDISEKHWAYEEILDSVKKGIVNGYSDNTFRPQQEVTNAHFETFIARSFFKNEIPRGDGSKIWYMPFAYIVQSKGITDNTKIGKDFDLINSPISRYDMAQMLYNTMKAIGVDMPGKEALKKVATAETIKDWNQIPDQYKKAVAICYSTGILNGFSDGSFSGQENMNRAQGCIVTARLSQYQKDHPDGEAVYEDWFYDPVLGEYPPFLKNGEAVTEKNVLSLMEELKKKYPAGTKWDNNTIYDSEIFYKGGGCAAFAYKISDEIFGKLPRRVHMDESAVRPGDVIQIMDNSGNTIHWCVATTASDTHGHFKTAHGNVNDPGIIVWEGVDAANAGGVHPYLIHTRYPF